MTDHTNNPPNRGAASARCPAAHLNDARPCEGPLDAVVITDGGRGSAIGCVLHGAIMYASLTTVRVTPGPGHRDGDCVDVYNRSRTLRPFDGVA